MGKRTSIYLSDDLAAAVEASGLSLGTLLRQRLGLAPETAMVIDPGREITTSPAEPWQPPKPVRSADLAVTETGRRNLPSPRRCPHPGTRVTGGWCAPCGVRVLPGGYLPGEESR